MADHYHAGMPGLAWPFCPSVMIILIMRGSWHDMGPVLHGKIHAASSPLLLVISCFAHNARPDGEWMDERRKERANRTSLMRLSRRNGRVDLNRGGKHVEWMMAHTLLSAWKIHYFLLYQMRSIKSITLSIRVWCGPCSSQPRNDRMLDHRRRRRGWILHLPSNKGQIIFKANFAMLRHSQPTPALAPGCRAKMKWADFVFAVQAAVFGRRSRCDKNEVN